MTYNDYGHINPDPKVSALGNQIGPKSVITFPSGGQKLSGPGFYEISGLAWSGGGAIRKVEISTDGGKNWKDAELRTPRLSHGPYPLRPQLELGRKRMRCCFRAAPTNSAPCSRPAPSPPNISTSPWTRISACPAPTTRFNLENRQRWERSQWSRINFFRSSRSWVCGSLAWAQSPTYGVGRTPTAEEIRAWDISISPTGKELPPGHGTAKEGEQLFKAKGCAGCHGATGIGARAPALVKGGPPAPGQTPPRHGRNAHGPGYGNHGASLALRRRRSGIISIAACLSIERER